MKRLSATELTERQNSILNSGLTLTVTVHRHHTGYYTTVLEKGRTDPNEVETVGHFFTAGESFEDILWRVVGERIAMEDFNNCSKKY